MLSAVGKAIPLLLIITGTVVWSLTMIKSGLIYPFGMGFWGPNGHDGVWHVALINHLASGSLEMPIFAGESIKNYHLFYDGLLALVHRITAIPAQTLYFQIFSPITAFLVGWLTYKFVLNWRRSKVQALFAVFFVYFGGSWGWLISFLRGGEIAGGESIFWANQAISTLINPPYASSLVLLLTGLILFLKYQKKPTSKLLILQAIIFGALIQFKAYAGVIALGGLLIVALFDFFKIGKIWNKNTKVFIAALIVSFAVFIPTNKNAGNLLVFSLLWLPETMLSFPDRFYWPKLASAISTYKAEGNFIKLIPAEVLALSIFWFGNLGTRVFKEFLVLRWLFRWRKLESIEVFVIAAIAIGIALPLLFIQKGNPWNTIQFIYYSLFFSGILAGIFLGEVVERKRFGWLIASVAIVLTLPTTIGTLRHYLPARPPAAIPYIELEALEFLKNQPQGIVLTYPFDPALRKNWEPPQPLWVYETTSYVSAFSGKSVFLEDEMNLEITGYDWRLRREMAVDFFAGGDYEFLEKNSIEYIYLVNRQKLPFAEEGLGFSKVFENSQVRIYKRI